MTRLVGVIDPLLLERHDSFDTAPLKQQSLLFDSLVIPSLQEIFLNKKRGKLEDRQLDEVNWLVENGIIINPQNLPTELSHPAYEKEVEGFIRHSIGVLGTIVGIDPQQLFEESERGEENEQVAGMSLEELEDFARKLEQLPEALKKRGVKLSEVPGFINQAQLMMVHQTRMYSIVLREVEGLNAYPVLSTTIPTAQESPATKSEVLRIILNSLPVPDESTPWEQILEFRGDHEAADKFLDLRNWMNEVACAKLAPVEIQEKLEYLISRYRRHLELHRMKVNAGTLETIIVTIGEFLENIAHLKFGGAAKTLFSLRHRQIALMEGELLSPGSEIAYVVEAREKFMRV